MRVRFEKGQQERFLRFVSQKTNLNLREISEKIKCDYFCIKKYNNENCSLPDKVFIKLCKISGINPNSLQISYFPDNLGQIIGGKRGIMSMRMKYAGKLKNWRAKGGKNHTKF